MAVLFLPEVQRFESWHAVAVDIIYANDSSSTAPTALPLAVIPLNASDIWLKFNHLKSISLLQKINVYLEY